MGRSALLLSLLVAGLSVGCKGGAPDAGTMSVDDIAATPPAGLTMKKLDTDDKVALDFLDPPGIEAGCTDASHAITNEGVSYAVYDYESDAVATMAMSLWKTGQLGNPPFAFQAATDAFPGLGENGLILQNKDAVTLANRVGKRIVTVTSTDAVKAGLIAGHMTLAIGGTVPTPAP